jgi:hypothetical protein
VNAKGRAQRSGSRRSASAGACCDLDHLIWLFWQAKSSQTDDIPEIEVELPFLFRDVMEAVPLFAYASSSAHWTQENRYPRWPLHKSVGKMMANLS